MENYIGATKDSSIWEFNYKPDRYIHKSWLATVPNGKLLEKLRSSKRDTTQLSQYLLSQLGFNGEFYFDFSNNPLANVALLPLESLEKLIKYIGVTYNHQEINKAISKQDVSLLKKTLGNDIYDFAFQQAPLIAKKKLSSLNYSDDTKLHEKIISSGIVCLHSAFQKQPAALRKRLLIKLPKEWINISSQYIKPNNENLFSVSECIYITHKASKFLK